MQKKKKLLSRKKKKKILHFFFSKLANLYLFKDVPVGVLRKDLELRGLTVHSAARLWERAAVLESLPIKQIPHAEISYTITSLCPHKKEAVLMLTPSVLCA